ncbi:MAG: HNH endonuclease family protein [Pseudomonas sp.]|nr:HNH endonuclease family protein [Pseudomonas sp.]
MVKAAWARKEIIKSADEEFSIACHADWARHLTALAIEHILSQKWDEHWPLPKTVQKSPQGRQAFTEQRERLKHTLGNLTLVAGSLDLALSRSPWEVKKAELLRYGQPVLSRELHELEDWAEREILARGEVLAEVACGVWRYPVGA